MRTKTPQIYVADFETTVYDGQERTDVWAAAIVKLFTEDVHIFHSIDELFDYMISIDSNIIVYFHNLKFDGEFWLSFLLYKANYKQALEIPDENIAQGKFIENKYMRSGTFKYSISDMGQWYTMSIKHGNYYIELRDSLKLLPISVSKIGKSFGTKHKKTEIEYTGYRYPGCNITEKEKEYIANDVLVVKEAIEIMYNQGHKKLTIGSCCLSEYKAIMPCKEWEDWFPNLYEMSIDEETFGSSNIGMYIRHSYHGGWCYVAKGKQNKIYHNGTTADVNSLYPSMMHSESGNKYPIGMPQFWIGNYIPDEAKDNNHYYFIRVRTRFKIKRGYLPFIQIKNNILYRGNECLETSDILSRIDGKYHSTKINTEGELEQITVILTLTETDFKLMQEHYNLIDCEILDGCYFRAVVGLFDEYIDKYKKIKVESKGAVREIAKLFLNNLYGKMATNTNSSFKVARQNDDGTIGYYRIIEHDKTPGYIPIGSAITSYARNFTIRAAQKNYHGKNKPGFIYADTDSIHCDLPPEKLEGIKVDDNNFCCWKLESQWDEAIFVRQKTYIEHITHENLKPIDNPYYNVKCAGMPEHCKELFLYAMGDDNTITKLNNEHKQKGTTFTQEELEWLNKNVFTLLDFKIGLEIPGKLIPRRLPGGIVLMPTTYKLRQTFS